jgi:hypothetical protein
VPEGLRQALELELVHSIQRLHIGGAQQLRGDLVEVVHQKSRQPPQLRRNENV